MSPEGIVITLALLIITALWVGAPLLRRETPRLSDDALLHKQRLQAYYERVLTNIRDLDEDHATGKISTATYEVEREVWVERGIQLLKALDSLGGQASATGETVDDEIEAAIAAYRVKRTTPETK
jgi:hypothetical protein